MLRNRGAALALAALIVIGTLCAWRLSTEPAANQRDKTHRGSTNKEASQYYPFNRFGHWLAQFWDWSTHDSVGFFTFVLAIFTGSLVVVSAVQIRYLRRADQTARISANAAAAASDTATAALHNSQRPWVIAENLRLMEPITIEPERYFIHALIDYRNTGTSLASAVQVWIRMCSMNVATLGQSWQTVVDDFRHHLEVTRSSPWPIGIVLAPNQSVTQSFGWGGLRDFDAPTVQDVRGGAFLLLGYLEYTDQFGLRHRTRFAFHPDADSVHPWDFQTFRVAGGYQEAS